MRVMKLYSVCDSEDTSHPENHWMAIWACSEQEALGFARENYDGDGYLEELTFTALFNQNAHNVFSPLEEGAHTEYRLEVQRYIGWGLDDGLNCESCNLSCMGEDRWKICGTCNECPECVRCNIEQDPDYIQCEACKGRLKYLEDVEKGLHKENFTRHGKS